MKEDVGSANGVGEFDSNKRWVRISRITTNGFVEFDFFVADEDLCAELILPISAFKEFCATNKVEIVADTLASMVGVERIARGLQVRIRRLQ